MHSKKKKKSGGALLIVLIIILAAVFLFCAYKLYTIFSEYKAGENVYESVTESFVTEIAPAQKTSKTPEGPETAPEESEVPIKINFDALCERYDDVVGWIYSEDTVISYPVVRGEDNEYYLHHLINGDYNGSGTIFMDYYNEPDLSNDNTVLYGHHMKNGSMFRSIADYDQEYYEKHPVMYYLTPEKTYRVEIFAGFVTPADSDTYVLQYGDEEEYADYLQKAVQSSEFETDVSVSPEDHILTLSTCTYVYDNARYVLQGKLVEIEE